MLNCWIPYAGVYHTLWHLQHNKQTTFVCEWLTFPKQWSSKLPCNLQRHHGCQSHWKLIHLRDTWEKAKTSEWHANTKHLLLNSILYIVGLVTWAGPPSVQHLNYSKSGRCSDNMHHIVTSWVSGLRCPLYLNMTATGLCSWRYGTSG